MADLDITALFSLPTAQRRDYAAGAAVFRLGDPCHAIFLTLKGSVRLTRVTADGKPLTVYIAPRGATFAEAAAFAEHYHCDAVADEDSTVTSLPTSVVREVLASGGASASAFAGHLARQVQDLRFRLELSTVRAAAERVLIYLDYHADKVTGTVCLTPTIKAAAAEIGLSHEAFYRALAGLERDGAIVRPSPKVVRLIS